MLKTAALILIAASACTVGFGFAGTVQAQCRQLEDLSDALLYMKNEMTYRMTPLCDIFEALSCREPGAVGALFASAAQALQSDCMTDAYGALNEAVASVKGLVLSAHAKRTVLNLAASLGKFDIDGQERVLALAQEQLASELISLRANASKRAASYRTIGICAGLAAAVILV